MLKRRLISVVVGVGALVGGTSLALADEPYIPLISKGFQHQFWQAVKAGAEQSAKENNVKITFEGPETEAMVDKQIDMLSAALAKKKKAAPAKKSALKKPIAKTRAIAKKKKGAPTGCSVKAKAGSNTPTISSGTPRQRPA